MPRATSGWARSALSSDRCTISFDFICLFFSCKAERFPSSPSSDILFLFLINREISVGDGHSLRWISRYRTFSQNPLGHHDHCQYRFRVLPPSLATTYPGGFSSSQCAAQHRYCAQARCAPSISPICHTLLRAREHRSLVGSDEYEI